MWWIYTKKGVYVKYSQQIYLLENLLELTFTCRRLCWSSDLLLNFHHYFPLVISKKCMMNRLRWDYFSSDSAVLLITVNLIFSPSSLTSVTASRWRNLFSTPVSLAFPYSPVARLTPYTNGCNSPSFSKTSSKAILTPERTGNAYLFIDLRCLQKCLIESNPASI